MHPFDAEAHYELGRALYDERNLGPAIEAFGLAVLHGPDVFKARFGLGVALVQRGDAKAAEEQFAILRARGSHRGAIDSFRYAMDHKTPATRFFTTTRETLLYGIDRSKSEGLVIELGVRYAISTRHIATRVPEVHGFDSFEGLPESWHILPAGVYSTHGEPPDVPANVKFHVGVFADTLPAFFGEHSGQLRFINVDCDLYSSTKCALTAAGDRIAAGTVLVFDEYLINDRWREDEYKALQEFVDERKLRYEYIAFSFFSQQAAVKIL
jgi:Macrocin-O-methyltransferase (TylF)